MLLPFCSESVVKTILSASVSDTLTEMPSFRPTAFARTLVDSPDDIQHFYDRVKMPLALLF